MAGLVREHADDLVRRLRLHHRAVIDEDAAAVGNESVEDAFVDDHHLDVLLLHAGGAQDRPRVVAQQLLRLGVAQHRGALVLGRRERRRHDKRGRRGEGGQFQRRFAVREAEQHEAIYWALAAELAVNRRSGRAALIKSEPNASLLF